MIPQSSVAESSCEKLPVRPVFANNHAGEERIAIAGNAAEKNVGNAAATTPKRRQTRLAVELAILCLATAMVFALSSHFSWFEHSAAWVLRRRDMVVDEVIIAAIFLIGGLSVLAFCRWRESESRLTSHVATEDALRLISDELRARVKERTTELELANDAFRAEAAERARAEATLRMQSAALTAASNAIVITDREGVIKWANPAFTTLTGYSLDEAIGRNPRELVKSGQQDPAVYRNLWETISGGDVWKGELINRRKDGRLYPEEQTITPVIDAEGAITHFIALKHDLTDRRAIDHMIDVSRRQFEAVFAQAAVGMAVVEGKSGRFVKVNRRFCEIVGYTSAELWAMTFGDLRDADADKEQLAPGREAGEYSGENRCRRKNGSQVWVRISMAPLDPSETSPGLRIAVVEDCTERRLAKAALQQSEERYRLLFENNPFPMWVYDCATLRFVAVNMAAVQHYGYTREEFLGMTLEDIRPAEDISKMIKFIWSRENDTHRTFDGRHCRKDGTVLRVEVTSRSLRFDGRDARLVLASDVTEKRLIEEKLLHSQRLENLGMLAAGVAHDLNNVLSPIMFAAPMLRDSLSSPQDLRIVATLEQSAQRGAALVRQILAFTHSTTSELRPVQVKHLCREIAHVVEETFPKSIELECHVAFDLRPILGNATQIHQVLLNLCVNARDAMPKGGKLRLTAANRDFVASDALAFPGASPGAWIVLEIGDTGAGISADILPRIWEPFFTTKNGAQGTGLGLSTVRGIVASHGGFVLVDTAPGRGSTFSVFLPVTEEESVGDDQETPGIPPEGRGELILVVEDEAAVRETLVATLEKHGYSTVAAEDGLKAVKQFTERAPEFALVITDVDMPKLGGHALARILTELRPDLRLLVISGLSRDTRELLEDLGEGKLLNEFLPKPFSRDALLAKVHELLSRR